jgi:hypothetical protein
MTSQGSTRLIWILGDDTSGSGGAPDMIDTLKRPGSGSAGKGAVAKTMHTSCTQLSRSARLLDISGFRH